MPGFSYPEDVQRSKEKEIIHRLQGHRLRSWLIRLGLTQVGDVLRGRIYPKGRTVYD